MNILLSLLRGLKFSDLCSGLFSTSYAQRFCSLAPFFPSVSEEKEKRKKIVIPIIFRTNTTSPSDFVYSYTSSRNLLIPFQLKGLISLISSLLPLP